MKKTGLLMLGLGMFVSTGLNAQLCPDPQTSSLRWGEPPAPWVENPYSSNSPQGEEGTRFVKADVLLTSGLGQGIVCTYKNSIGLFSIWQAAKTKIPSRNDPRWIDTSSGYVCTQSLMDCEFFLASEQ